MQRRTGAERVEREERKVVTHRKESHATSNVKKSSSSNSSKKECDESAPVEGSTDPVTPQSEAEGPVRESPTLKTTNYPHHHSPRQISGNRTAKSPLFPLHAAQACGARHPAPATQALPPGPRHQPSPPSPLPESNNREKFVLDIIT
ncbi:hypothetical protein E2C01_019487 [Portunus trituberculatus]|uniref:Uncharacterized protein n=1 Tax=Portunus trituberculatus TaxID=210409 RepID=A0A5B7DXC3_PORTR|nr:hypothetical protein [Portunus trituberculatus]